MGPSLNGLANPCYGYSMSEPLKSPLKIVSPRKKKIRMADKSQRARAAAPDAVPGRFFEQRKKSRDKYRPR